MFTPNLGFVLLFVSNPQKSGLYYQDLFGIKPIEESSTFVMFALKNGVMLGLWSKYTAEPRIEAPREPYTFEMSEDFIPWRRNIKFLKSKEIPIEPLLEKLNFIKDKKKWGFPFRRGSFEIPFCDFELIAKSMGVSNE